MRYWSFCRVRQLQKIPDTKELGSRTVIRYLTGDDWLRQGDRCIYMHGGSGYLPKNTQTLSANKTARGVLSPIQVKDLGFAFA